MIEKGLAAIATAVTIGLITAFLVRPVLRRLPEPIPGSGKPIYRDLGTTRFVLVCGSLAGIAAAVSWLTVPRYVQPLWSVLAILGVLLAAIDARTSWLPLLAREVGFSPAGAAIAGGLYLLVWLLSRSGFGFGDVRFAPLLGAPAAAGSWTLLWWTLLLGTVAGGLVGVLRLVQRRREGFPYAPPMLVGAYAACLITTLS